MSINRASVRLLILWLLAITTTVTLLSNVPSTTMLSTYTGPFVIYALLTAFALYLGVVLSEGELSSAHVIGMVALLSLPYEAQRPMLWSIAAGGVLGGLLLVTRTGQTLPHRPLTERTARSVVVITARVTLSFFVAAYVYSRLQGELPLNGLGPEDGVPLLALSLVYILVYLAIFLLETYSDGRSVQRLLGNNAAELLTVLTLPIPFALLVAEIHFDTSLTAFTILVAGVMLTIWGQYSISSAQYQLRRQLDELKSLSVMSQVVSANLNLDALLKMVYLQVSQLLDVNNFLVALYERSDKPLDYPLAIRQGEPEQQNVAKVEHNALIHHVLKTQQPLLISHDVHVQAQKMGLTPPSPNTQSWMGVPLLSGGRLLGAMVVTSSDSNQRFSSDDLRLLNIVAANASIAIENAQLYEQQISRVNQLAALNTVLSLLTDTLSPETVLDTVISSAAALSGASAVAVYLFWEDGQQSSPRLVRSSGFSEQFTLAPPDPLLVMNSYKQLLNQSPVVVSDMTQDDRTLYLRNIMAREGKAAWVELPLAVAGYNLGVMVLYYDEPGMFTDEQIELLRAFANQVAQAIRNARLYAVADETLERRVGQLLALAAIGHELTATIDIKTICSLVLNHALDATSASIGVLLLKDTSTGKPKVIAQRGYPQGIFSNAEILTRGITGRALNENEPILLNDVFSEKEYLPLMPLTRSQLSAPIIRAGSILGVITLESDRMNAFSEEDSHFVTQLANQAVIAIDNAYLFQRIAEARDRLQVILDAMAEAIVLIDINGKIALANPRVAMIGLTPERLLDHDIDDLLEHPEIDLAERMGFRSDQEVRKLIKEARQPNGWVGREPVSYPVENGASSLYVQRQVIPVHDASDQIIGVMLVFYDQTEEHALAEARENLSNMIVHDLRSPLTAVTTGLKLLTNIVPKDSEFRPMIETTTESSRGAIRKLLNRVDSLLDIARMETGQMNLDVRTSSLSPLVESVRGELSPLAQELNVTIQTDISPTLQALAIDVDKVERVLLNLLDNALKFSPVDSTVTIGARSAEGQFVRIDVIDRGPGIPEDYKSRLFDRFVQVSGRSGNRRGSGLGLTFCRLVVEAHGGRIWIEDNPQGGSVFAFTLPVAEPVTMVGK